MHFYICEDTLAGFFTAVYESYYGGVVPDRISASMQDVLLGDTYKKIAADKRLARRVREGINKIDRDAYRDVEYVFASEVKGKLNIIYEYLKLLFREKRKLTDRFAAHAVVRDFSDIVLAVRHEAHRMTGFIRFQELTNGVLYAYFSGDSDVLQFIMPHFAERFNTERFILHDIRLNKLAVYEDGKYTLAKSDGEIVLEHSAAEMFYLGLWKEYNNNVSIASRKNTKQQNRCAPRRYRWFMSEFDN